MKKLYIILVGILTSAYSFSQVSSYNFNNFNVNNLFNNTEILKEDSMIVKPKKSHSVKKRSITPKSYYGDGDLHPQIANKVYTYTGNHDVGEIGYSSSVTPFGAMQVTIPIEKYEDPRGFMPEIAITYSHLGNNGCLGKGRGISGLSSITRGPKNIYYDNMVEPEFLDPRILDNALYLNGIRLVKLIPETPENRYSYQSETGNIKVKTILYNANGGPMAGQYQVFYPNGSMATFGVPVAGPAHYPELPIIELKDISGNVIKYDYEYINGHFRIKKITYGLNSQGVIEFTYETRRSTSRPTNRPSFIISTRSDEPTFFKSGIKIKYDYALSKIECKANNEILRTYSFRYKSAGIKSLLAQIDCKAQSVSLSPLKFEYGIDGQVRNITSIETQMMYWYNYTNSSQVRALKGKFDAYSDDDGIIIFPNKISFLEKKGARMENQYKGDENIQINIALKDNIAMGNQVATGAGFVDIFSANLDEFPEDEIIKVNQINEGSIDKVSFNVYTPNIYYGLGKKYTRTYSLKNVYANKAWRSVPRYCYTGDFNGDGKMDVLVVTPKNVFGAGNKGYYYIIDLEGDKILYQGDDLDYWVQLTGDYCTDGQEAANRSDKLFVTDVFGAGKDNILIVGEKGTSIIKFTQNGTTITGSKPVNLNSTVLTCADLTNRLCMIGEFNGDGKPDLLVSLPYGVKPTGFNRNVTPNNNNAWRIYNMDGAYDVSMSYININETIEKDDVCFLQDLNNDGVTDLVLYMPKRTIQKNTTTRPSYNSSSSISTSSTRPGSSRPPTEGNTTSRPSTSTENNMFVYIISDNVKKYENTFLIDKNALIVPSSVQSRNTFSHLITVNSQGKGKIITYNFNDGRNSLLSALVNSYGNVFKIDYSELNGKNDYYGIYEKGYGAKYPYRNYVGSMLVTARTETYIDGVKVDYTNYSYKNGVYHTQGLGFRGFTQINGYSSLNGSRNQEYDPFNYSVLKKDENNKSSSEYTYTYKTLSNKSAQVQLTTNSIKNKMTNNVETHTYTYDIFGNAVKELIKYSDGISSTISNTVINVDDGKTYYLGIPKEQITINTRDGQSASTKMAYTYNEKNLPLTKISFYNANNTANNFKKVSEEIYVYDTQSNLIESKTRSYDSPDWFTLKYSYDTSGKMIAKTDPTGIILKYGYDSASRLINITDQANNIIKYTYDSWGKLTKVENPDGSIETISFSWSSSPTNAIYKKTEAKTNTPTKESYYDSKNRLIRSGTQRFDGSYLYVDNIYNDKDILIKNSVPFKTNPSLWNTLAYDVYDRLIEATYVTGKKEIRKFEGLKVTVTKDNITSSQVYDVLGQVLTSTDPGGTVIFTLRPDNQVSKIVAHNDIVTSFEFDAYGRQIAIVDPSLGRKTVTYDNKGNLIKETDARGKVTNYTYDNFDKLVKKEFVGEFSTTYVYDNFGKLISESATNGISRTITYNNLGQVTKERENIVDGKWLEKTHTYVNGTKMSVKYTSQSGYIGSEDYGFINGYLTEIKWNNTLSLWKMSKEDDMGNISEVISNNIVRQYAFTPLGLPTSRQVINKNTGTLIQKQEYDFNPLTGNLRSRKDFLNGKTENFTYDNLNRLVAFPGKRISFDPKGNITSINNDSDNSILASYNYSKANPFQIESITPYGNAVPLTYREIQYNAMMRVTSLKSADYTASLVYNDNGSRKKMDIKKNNVSELIRYYIGDQYEIDGGTKGVKEKLYIGGDAYSASAVYVKEGTTWNMYFIARDYLGSITHVIDESGKVKQEISYDAWGRLRDPKTQALYDLGKEPELFLGRGYTGHEYLMQFSLINMNARLYDPVLGRFISPDPQLQSPLDSQNYNRYGYAMNNPLKFTDPNGEFFFAILVGIIVGAAIGAAVSAAVYLVSAAITGGFSWKGFLGSVGMGALGGAIGGGLGAVGGLGFLGSFGNSFGFNMIAQVSSSMLTNVIYGNSITFGSILGMVAGGLVGGALPNFKAIGSSAFKNVMAEIGFSTGKGAIRGFATGLVTAAVDRNEKAIWQHTVGGAIGGAVVGIGNNLAMGAPYKPESPTSKVDAVYRRGNFITRALGGGRGTGIALGRNLVINGFDDDQIMNQIDSGGNIIGTVTGREVNIYLEAHEPIHLEQQMRDGWSNFYARTIREYIKYGLSNVYSTPGTYENEAEWGAAMRIGHYMNLFSDGRNIYVEKVHVSAN